MVVRLLAAACLFCVFVIWQLPASVFDTAIDRYSDGKLRLADAHGTIWRGSGMVMVSDTSSDYWQAWTTIDWNVNWGALLRGGLGWQIMSQDTSLAKVELAASGVRVDQLHLRGPARIFLQQMQNVVGRAGWRGDVAIDAAHWQCSWQRRCDGSADLRWFGAASDLLEGRVFGDYQVLLLGNGDDIEFHWDTLQGSIRTKGDGRWDLHGTPSFAGTISGDATLLKSLSGIASRWARSTPDPNVWSISMP